MPDPSGEPTGGAHSLSQLEVTRRIIAHGPARAAAEQERQPDSKSS
jgi:hypothetical protein